MVEFKSELTVSHLRRSHVREAAVTCELDPIRAS